ncbi:5-oxoprolinase [Sphingobacterium oryzagri]|uniref:5-oxoprolinase n=1 Tax=Sphingobacterium oryzagri TaxID=3025669 RepID=A0ABY7WKX8_9SPHI|nr:5-oxoprolinase [Sphingobacterium sp. KACC 22765]WDF70248.1 5-oxoprolinase [Sphingobacterium sp. KACC 22765]
MSTAIQLSSHLQEQFSRYSIPELITFNNDIVENRGWGTSRSTFRNAILKALAKKGIDLSPIISKEDGFSVIQIVKVRLENNSLVPLRN